MGVISSPQPVKLIVGMLAARPEVLAAAAERLTRDYGPIDIASDVTDFAFTDYYSEDMGGGLLRQFVAFERLIAPDALAAVKRAANDIEAEFARAPMPQMSGLKGSAADGGGPARPVNLDPGYVTESKLVLASTKDFAHRIYLRDGIYAEVTLTYAGGRWAPHRQTFPDYASGAYDAFLSRARRALRRQLGRKEHGG